MSSYDYSASSASFDQRMAIDAAASERLAFIKRTYLHVAGALAALTIVLAALVNFVPDEVTRRIFWANSYGPMLLFIGFLGITWLAQRMAQADMSAATQYSGLGLMIAAYAYVLWPTVWIATTNERYAGILGQAVILTLALSGGLTLSVLTTKKDFSFLGSGLSILSVVVIGTLLAGYFFGFYLGLWFSLAVIALMSAFLLYETSVVLHHLRTNQHVIAACMIFSTIATLFVWIVRALAQSRD